MTPRRDLLVDYQSFSDDMKAPVVQTASSQLIRATGMGRLRAFILNRQGNRQTPHDFGRTLHLPNLATTLISSGQLRKDPDTQGLTGDGFSHIGPDAPYLRIQNITVPIHEEDNVPKFLISLTPLPDTTICIPDGREPLPAHAMRRSNLLQATTNDLVSLHKKYNHCQIPHLGKLFDISIPRQLPFCEPCAISNITKSKHGTTARQHNTTLVPGAIIHSDCSGKITPPSLGGSYQYWVTFTDEFTRHTMLYLLAALPEVALRLRQYIIDMKILGVEIPTKMQGTILHSDNDPGAYTSANMIETCIELGIKQTHSPPHVPQQNAISERAQLMITDPVRVALQDADLPPTFWGARSSTSHGRDQPKPTSHSHWKNTPRSPRTTISTAGIQEIWSGSLRV